MPISISDPVWTIAKGVALGIVMGGIVLGLLYFVVVIALAIKQDQG